MLVCLFFFISLHPTRHSRPLPDAQDGGTRRQSYGKEMCGLSVTISGGMVESAFLKGRRDACTDTF